MKTYIKVTENNEIIGHPDIEDNLKYLIPGFDPDNLPEGWVVFNKCEIQRAGPYEIWEGFEYVYDATIGEVNEVNKIRALTEEESLAKQNLTKQNWDSVTFASWTFDEATCSFVPPVPRPEGKGWMWRESIGAWDKLPPQPSEGTTFDKIDWQWK